MADNAPGTEIVQTETDIITTTKPASFILARIKPFNPKAGLKVKTYTYRFGGQAYRFREEAGWYRIPAALGEELKLVVSDEADPYSPFLFDVLSEAEASKVEELEHKRRERATALRPNTSPDLRRQDTRRLASAARAARTSASTAVEGVMTTQSLRAPNDEEIPNGYPPPRTYPMPQPGGGTSVAAATVASAIESGHDDELIEQAKRAGVDDKTLGTSAANLTRDMNAQPLLVDGQGTAEDDDDFNLEGGDTNFGPDPVEGEERPASPPSARRRRRGG